MSVVKRIAAEDQTVVVVAEAEYIAVLLFFDEPCAKKIDDPDEVILLGANDAERLAGALLSAVERTTAAA